MKIKDLQFGDIAIVTSGLYKGQLVIKTKCWRCEQYSVQMIESRTGNSWRGDNEVVDCEVIGNISEMKKGD